MYLSIYLSIYPSIYPFILLFFIFSFLPTAKVACRSRVQGLRREAIHLKKREFQIELKHRDYCKRFLVEKHKNHASTIETSKISNFRQAFAFSLT